MSETLKKTTEASTQKQANTQTHQTSKKQKTPHTQQQKHLKMASKDINKHTHMNVRKTYENVNTPKDIKKHAHI